MRRWWWRLTAAQRLPWVAFAGPVRPPPLPDRRA